MSISRTSRMGRHLPLLRSAAGGVLLGALLLTACGDFVENIPPRPVASDDEGVAATPYPSLAAVPARPQLGYALQQRRDIAEGLVADRAHARHAGDALRAERGRPVEPDTAPPLPPLPEVAPPPATDPAADLALAYVEESLARDSDEGSLSDFLDRLERRPPARAEARPDSPPDPEPSAPVPTDPLPAPPAATGGAEVEPVASPPAAEPPGAVVEPDPPMSAVPAPPAVVLVDAVDDVAEPAVDAGTDKALPAPIDAAAAAAVTRPAPAAAAQLSLPLAVLFDPDQVQLAAASRARVENIARVLRDHSLTVVVSGGGARAGLAMERARRVAALLVSGGFPPDRIAIEMGGEQDAVVVYEAKA